MPRENSARRSRRDHHDPDPRRRAEALKERIYVTFTSLAVVIALSGHVDEEAAGAAIGSVALTAFGTVLTVFVADVIAHMTAYSSLPARDEVTHMAQVSFGALGAIVTPLILLALAAADVMTLSTSLRISAYVLVGTLAAVTFIAVRRLRIPTWQKLLALVATVLLGLLVVVVELAVH